MIPVEEIIVGRKVWHTELRFSLNSFKIISKCLPKEYTIESIHRETKGYIKDVVTLRDKAGIKTKLYNILERYGKNIEYALYDSEKEAYEEGWNPLVLNELDHLDSFYQEKKKYLKSKIQKT